MKKQIVSTLMMAVFTLVFLLSAGMLLAYYGADAFGTEPLPQDSRLRSLPNAILTPHIAWTTKEALQRLMDITTNNLRTWLEGKGDHIVNP